MNPFHFDSLLFDSLLFDSLLSRSTASPVGRRPSAHR